MSATLFLDMSAAAEAASVSEDTLKAAVKEGTLRAKRTGKAGGGKYLISRAALEEWFDGLVDA